MPPYLGLFLSILLLLNPFVVFFGLIVRKFTPFAIVFGLITLAGFMLQTFALYNGWLRCDGP